MKTLSVLVLLVAASLTIAAAPPVNGLKQGVRLSINGDHEASEEILRKIKSSDPSYTFFRLVNAFKLNKKEEVEKLADEIIYAFSGQEYPTRYKDLAYIMKGDASTWKKAPDDLADISRDMTKITDRLNNKKGGPETQRQQKEVLNRLGKMIKDIEDKQKAAQDAAEKAQAEAQKGRDGQGRDQSTNPAQDTIPSDAKGTGRVDQKRVKEIAEVWGKLPEKERARAMVELTRTLPAKDKAIIEAYFKELAKRSNKR